MKNHADEYRGNQLVRKRKSESEKSFWGGLEGLLGSKLYNGLKLKKRELFRMGRSEVAHNARQKERREAGRIARASYEYEKGK